jgi:hypothetical protein
MNEVENVIGNLLFGYFTTLYQPMRVRRVPAVAQIHILLLWSCVLKSFLQFVEVIQSHHLMMRHKMVGGK